jgi:prepilin-type N-terminal cleavage/methylation domain-containing protein
MKASSSRRTSGFTVIELLVVIVLVVILGSLVALTYSGVRAKNRNASRQTTVDALQGQLEAFYAENSKYPTLADLNNATWRSQQLKNLPSDALQDPRWNKDAKSCTTDGKPVATTTPAANCYSYQVTAANGDACDNVKTDCAHYTLTALLEGGDKYVKSSLN